MTKKDYQFVADILAKSEALSSDQKLALADDFAAKFAQDNPLFSAERFIAAIVGSKPKGKGKR